MRDFDEPTMRSGTTPAAALRHAMLEYAEIQQRRTTRASDRVALDAEYGPLAKRAT
jgi:hypothetical protein